MTLNCISFITHQIIASYCYLFLSFFQKLLCQEVNISVQWFLIFFFLQNYKKVFLYLARYAFRYFSVYKILDESFQIDQLIFLVFIIARMLAFYMCPDEF